MDFSFGLKREYISLNTIEINRKNLLFNFDFFRKETGLEIWPVLKSNAYGHGIKQVTKILEERESDYLVVDGYNEVLEIRKVSKRPVLIIGEIRSENFSRINWKNVTMMVGDELTIRELEKLNKRIRVHLKVNTGMNRQGINVDEVRNIVNLIKKYPKLELEGVFSHLAEADEVNGEKTDFQLKQFEKAIEIIEKNGVKLKFCHLAASAGALKIKSNKVNAIRLGIGLYGINVLEKRDKIFRKMQELKPVLNFKSCFTTLRRIKKGEKVSYGGTWQAKKDTNIGVIPVGYNEGLDRRLSNKGWVNYKNVFYPIVGRICMNLAMVDLGDTAVKLFDEVETISNNREDKNSIENMARQCKTIPYDLLVKVNSLVRRLVV
jgi:alanine racemase